ncbi:hypothetical protein [Nonomuraea sp. NPDC049400]|uniref:hypothetical protein n=1 Tax=Nonomuraea sp. NPDC049400 TaxID=3364352 RepID=UPI003787F4AB
MTENIDQIVARFAAPPVPEVSEGARELMHEITAGSPAPAPGRRRRRLSLRVAVPAGALLTAGIVALTWLHTTSPAAALDIKEEGGYYVIEIKDLYANPKMYEEQLRKYGLDVSLIVQPATAAFERQVLATAPDHNVVSEIQGINPPGPCDMVGDACAIGLKIPVGFKGTAQVSVSRKARPGEKYQISTTWDAKGEPLRCVPFFNKTVAEVRAMLKERGVRIGEFVVHDPTSKDISDIRTEASVPDTWLVNGGSLTEPGVATVRAHTTPVPQKFIDNRNKGNDCPTS